MAHFRRRNLLGIFLVSLIFYVSYKILEPEIWGTKLAEIEEKELQRLRMKFLIEDEHSFQHHRLTNTSNDEISYNRIAADLVKKFTLDFKYPLKESPWITARNWVTQRSVHPSTTPELGAILHSMATRKITHADVGYQGTQLKLTIILEGGQKCMFKPKWYNRSKVIEGDIYEGPDRHNGEIAVFHLGRLLDYRRAPLVVGRVIDMVTEIAPVAEQQLKETFYTKENNFCFHRKCSYCLNEKTGVCGEGTKVEGALILWLQDKMNLTKYKNPWRRTYKKNVLAKWETDADYCQNTVLVYSRYSSGPRLLDIIDASIVDYLVGNGDRHTFETINNHSTAVVLTIDNGKSFGNPYVDDRSILAPLSQCCQIRETTWSRLLILQDGVLSSVLETILTQDPIAPILTDLHLKALDRRLNQVLTTVKACFVRFGVNTVLVKNR